MEFSSPLHLYLTIVAAMALVALMVWLLVFLTRPSAARDRFRLAVPLYLKAWSKKKKHVFIAVSPYSKQLASSLLKEKKKSHILFVNLAPSFQKETEHRLRQELGSSIPVLGGHAPLLEDARTFAGALGLKGLAPWLSQKHTNLYLFSKNPEENAQLLSLSTDDPSIKAKIFYYSSDPNGYDSLVASTGARIRMLNPHEMSFTQLKLEQPRLMPVHFVQKAPGPHSGYVRQGLHALVAGFGNIGQEAVRFLYEYGSFVGEDFLRAPMSIDIYDATLPVKLGAFWESAPMLKADTALHWHLEAAGSVTFWENFEKDPELRYLIVAVDEGRRNIQLGVSLLKAAARSGKDLSRMLILVYDRQNTKKSRNILDSYNAAYCPEGAAVLHSFGDNRSIWNPDVISGRALKKTAVKLLEGRKSLERGESWDERQERLSRPGPDAFKNQMELRRRQSADISRALFAPSLLALAPEGEPDEKTIEYLSAQEHLHWMSALAVMGYTDGPLDELLKRHPDMVPYPEIKEDETRQRSLLSVKSLLQMNKKYNAG